ncbi:hypothetical protein LCGC14_1044930 [marine sediment metagenome]|uniref:NfeD-like C-terminal domain-containing protein n=1 Tax=marine sediment metagenome TaxID=412755 RepID=A0A0F9Q8Q1_9ZZZZ
MFAKIVLNKETFFWFFALSGSITLFIQLILNLFGLSDHHDIGDTDIDTGEIDTSNFKWLSKQALSGFFMMFGWIGLSCLKEFEFNVLLSLAIAFIAGVLAMFVSGFIFKMARKLHSSGTVFKIEDAIGLEAMIYQRILKKDKGKILISLNNLTREIDAIALNEEEIPSFTKVKIINKVDENTVSVVPIKIGDL